MADRRDPRLVQEVNRLINNARSLQGLFLANQEERYRQVLRPDFKMRVFRYRTVWLR